MSREHYAKLETDIATAVWATLRALGPGAFRATSLFASNHSGAAHDDVRRP